jgi:hypothetical protein
VGKPLEVMTRDPTKLVIGLPGRVEQRELHAVVALQVRRRQGRSGGPDAEIVWHFRRKPRILASAAPSQSGRLMRPPCGHWSPTLFPRDHTHCTTPHSETVLPCVDGDVRRLDCAGLRDRRWRVRTRVNCFRRAVRGVRASPSSHSALDQRLRAAERQRFAVVFASTLASLENPWTERGSTRC